MQSRSQQPLIALISGAVIGWFAWRPDGAVALVVLLLLLWTLQRARAVAMLLWLGYFLAGSRDVAPTVARFFPDEPLGFGIVLWLLDACLLTLPWTFLWPKDSASPRSVAMRAVSAMALFTVPPLGSIGWLSPVLAGGVLYPGWSWIGIGCLMTLIATLAVIGYQLRTNDFSRRWIMAAMGLFIAAICANLLFRAPEPAADWMAINTQLGPFPKDRYQAFERQQLLIRDVRDAIDSGARVIVLPEAAAGVWRGAVAYWWQEIDELAARRGATVLLGAEVPISPGFVEENASRFTNSLVLLGATRGTINARQPIPVSSWRPWSARGVVNDFVGSGVVDLHGLRGAISICYEDLLAWPMLVSFARRSQPDVLISAANNWFYSGTDSFWIQHRSVELWARLFGVALVRAVNTEPR